MHPEQAHVQTLPEAYAVIKEMNLAGEWGADLSRASLDAVTEVLEQRMDVAIDRHLEAVAARGGEDRRTLRGNQRPFWGSPK